MKVVAVLLVVCLVGLSWANEPSIVADEKEMNADGSYKFYYEQSDGQKRQETAELKTHPGNPEPYQALSVSGSYEYTDADGGRYQVSYTADENGYKPTVKKLN